MYCPKNAKPEERRGGLLWFWVGVSVCTSPILLWVFRKKLLKRGEDKPPEQAPNKRMRVGTGEGEANDESTVPEVPCADDPVAVGSPMAWGNAGAAWAGMGMGG